MKLLEKLEEFKTFGMYNVTLWYGEDVGCDDLDVEMLKRRVKLLAYPVGCIGEVKVFYVGTIESLLEFDVKTKPTQTSNPPMVGMFDEDGFYIWGTANGVETIMKRNYGGTDED